MLILKGNAGVILSLKKKLGTVAFSNSEQWICWGLFAAAD